jgi:hypothetical protein
MEIIPTDQFIRDLKRIGKKYPSIVDDLRQLQIALLKNPTQGVFLGNDCYKIRLKIASKIRGKAVAHKLSRSLYWIPPFICSRYTTNLNSKM